MLPIVTIEEVIERTGVSKATIYKAIREGKADFPAFRIGNRVVIPRDPFEEVMSGKVSTAKRAA